MVLFLCVLLPQKNWNFLVFLELSKFSFVFWFEIFVFSTLKHHASWRYKLSDKSVQFVRGIRLGVASGILPAMFFLLICSHIFMIAKKSSDFASWKFLLEYSNGVRKLHAATSFWLLQSFQFFGSDLFLKWFFHSIFGSFEAYFVIETKFLLLASGFFCSQLTFWLWFSELFGLLMWFYLETVFPVHS